MTWFSQNKEKKKLWKSKKNGGSGGKRNGRKILKGSWFRGKAGSNLGHMVTGGRRSPGEKMEDK